MPIWAFNRTVKKPELWAEFHEAVHKSKCTCHVLCKHCDKSYAHPSTVGKTTAVKQSLCLDICRAANAIETKKGIGRECQLLNLVWSQVRPLSLITTTIPWSTRH